MVRASQAGILVPNLLFVDKINRLLYMEYIDGWTLKQIVENEYELNENLVINVGKSIAILHKSKIIHGDLTTSNILVKKSDSSVV